MLLSIALFTGIFCAGCGARSDEILLESQEDTSDTVEETEQEEREMTDEIPSVTPEPQEIFVDVCGAVNQPGVYEMDPDSRVFQAIEAAGGMTEEASGISVNQAQPLSDGQQVYRLFRKQRRAVLFRRYLRLQEREKAWVQKMELSI